MAPGAFSLRGRGPLLNGAALLLATGGVGAALLALHLPAALLLAAIFAGATIAALEGDIYLPPASFLIAQAIIGGMIGRVFTGPMLAEIFAQGPLILGSAFATILAAGLLGALLARAGILPGSTPVWGSLPGAATAMTVLADAHGADMRLVAFMQYARVLIVALSASLLARFVAPDAFAGASPFDGPPTSFGGVAATLALLGAAAAFGRFTRLPAGVMLAPLAASGVAQASGLFAVELPTPLLALSYAALGWTVGLRFTRPLLRHALSALPAILASIVTLQLLCAGLSLLIARWAHVDPLTALLATSPGGLDAIAIIAVAAKLDLPFIMAAQTARFLLILAIGPRLAKALAHWAAPPNKSGRDAQNSSQDGLN